MSPRSSSRTAAFLCLLTPAALAQIHPVPPPRHGPRILPPRPPVVRIVATRVTSHIVDGLSDTTVAMTFRNDGARDGEKVLVLPLPKGATADRVEMKVGGRLQTGEVLAEDKARRIYESIVARRRDPALLEYMGRDLLRLRVFPIPARGRQDVTVRFRMLLPASGGLHAFEFPTRAVDGGTFAMDVTIDSTKAIKNVYSPLAGMDIVRKDDHHARASFECKGRPPHDPVLFYGLSDRDFGLDLLTYRKQGRAGYFVLMLAPKRDWKNEQEVRKSITFVLDTSGSMQGEKIEQAKNALRYFLKSLKPGDWFNVIPFSTEARPFAKAPVQATSEKVAAAVAFCNRIEARGGTNIEEALALALSAKPARDAVALVAFLTDGLPTVGVTDAKEILRSCTQKNTSHARVFVFGVGNDVNTFLLDELSGRSGGTRDYVRPGENLEVKVSALFEKLAHPVMTDLEIACDRIALSRMVPSKLPDMFRGSRLVVAGRYTGDGQVAIRLRGKVGGESKEFVYDARFPSVALDHDFVATIWAQRRIGKLLDAIRLGGRNAELVAEVRRLGKEHGIVTPYTSHIIVEEGEQVARRWGLPRPGAPAERDRRRLQREVAKAGLEVDTGAADEARKKAARQGRDNFGRLAQGPATAGAKAVADSTNTAGLLYQKSVDDRSRGQLWTMQRVGGRIFHLVGAVWVDATYESRMEKTLRKIVAFTPDYFALLRAHPELAKVLAFSTAMVITLGADEAVEILPPQ